MWLLPVFSALARFALRVFYRLSLGGERVPPDGPVLLVANHPNSLLDPAMVIAAARRRVRFLAKAPLFTDRMVGWLVKGAGAIPVYRRQDDPEEMGKNQDTFRAVWTALADGYAVGIFPEGISHSGPALVPLKTGAARIALGAARETGGAFPVIPVGLSFREKGTFRSDALATVGEPVPWDDLAAAGPDDWEAVRALTARIEDALETVTLNLERWEDAPLVEAAEAIYAAELPVSRDPEDRLARQREAAEGLMRLRAENRAEWNQVAREVTAHARLLAVLDLSPRELKFSAALPAVASWTARAAAFFGLGAPVAAAGIAVYGIPYHLTGLAAARARPPHDVRGTFKLLVGAVAHVLWTLALVALAWRYFGAKAGIAALVLLPAIGLVTVHVVERWTRAVGEGRRFFLRAQRREAIDELRARQRELARRLHALWEEVRAAPPPPPRDGIVTEAR